jgi:hypothetical protein
MSSSGTGYLLASFRFNSPSGSGTKTTMGGAVTGSEGYLRGRGLYDGFRHGAINPSSLVPIMG